jgi:Sec7-like guanine-nucleotide exchange factor
VSKTAKSAAAEIIEEEDASGQTVRSFEQAKSRKQLLKQGIALFNSKPKKGLEFLIQSAILEDKVDSIALFLSSRRFLIVRN